jgi:hypothetical protein
MFCGLMPCTLYLPFTFEAHRSELDKSVTICPPQVMIRLYQRVMSDPLSRYYQVAVLSIERLFRFILVLNLGIPPLCVVAQATAGPTPQQTLTSNEVSRALFAKCLPADIKLSDVVDATTARDPNGHPVGLHKVTVEQKLDELKAGCNGKNKLVDGSGREIIFYHLTGCWGNPPADYREILRKQRDEITRLKQQYAVIEMTCNPSGGPIL